VGNAGQFQGDERDVMFLSLVQSADGLLPLVSTRPYQQRFNVAASRARDQMWLVHSLDPATNLPHGDLRRKLIEHVQDPSASAREATAALARAESPFEVDVIKRLSAAGYHIKSNYRVGSYRIDIVVQGLDGRKLAIECDGARFHGPEELEYDMQRQADLERPGWRFVRVRGTEFYRDPDRALVPVFERLTAVEIEPLEATGLEEAPKESSDLLERVKLRAQEILAELELALQSGELLLADPRVRRGRQSYRGRAPTGDKNSAPSDHGSTETSEATKLFEDDVSTKPTLSYRDSIDGHSARALGNLTRWLYARSSFTSVDDLARGVSLELGYERFGSKIASRLIPLARRVIKEREEGRARS
jgi:very-short-patch-repair endonuclease